MKFNKDSLIEVFFGFIVVVAIIATWLSISMVVFASRYPVSKASDYYTSPGAMFLFLRTAEMEKAHAEATTYQVEVTVTRTKVVTIKARNAEHAEQRALFAVRRWPGEKRTYTKAR